MSDYKNIIGKPIKFVSSNLDNAEAEGQIWYNSTDNAFKNILISEAWASAANMINTRRLMADFGTNTTAVAAGGDPVPSVPGNLTATEHYNGTGWTTGGNLPQGMFNQTGAGVETAGLSIGGGDPPGARSVKTFEYDGSSWTAGGDLTEEREGGFGFGTQTAAVCAGGESLLPPGVAEVNSTDEYDGTSWTAVNNMTHERYFGASVGHTQTAGVVFGGPSPSGTNVELYDGTNWTSGGNTPSTQKNGQAASGVQTDAFLINAGDSTPTQTNDTSKYNGTTFTASVDTANTKSQIGAGKQAPSTSTAIAFGGLVPSPARVSTTEEYAQSINVITGAAWASGGNTTDRTGARLNFGTQTAGFSGGGIYVPNPGYTDEKRTEEYDGSSWTAGGSMPADKGRGAGFGVLTAGVVCGGTEGNTTVDTTFEYDGSSWTAGGALNVGRRYQAGFGTLTAGAICGGFPSTPNNGTETEEYNGTAWTNSNALNTARATSDAAGGTQTAAITFGGENPGTDKLANSEEYNGTSWSEGNDLSTPTKRNSGGGTSVPTTLSVGGQSGVNPPGTGQVEQYNGTSWVTSATMSVARSQIGKMQGNSASGLVNNGANASDTYIVTTEEFTGETSAVNVKTITTS